MSAYSLVVIAAGVFFLNGLLTGLWKFRQMVTSDDGTAHIYVDLAHRASLMYAFASILLAVFVNISQLPAGLELFAVSLLVGYFAIAIIGYMMHGYKRDTDNQMRNMSAAANLFLWSLVIAEIGGFLILFYGVLVALL
jgi:hypothetical protein